MLNLIFMICGLLHTASADEFKVIFDHPVSVYKPSNTGLNSPTAAAAGTEVPFEPNKIYWVEAPGHVPFLVLPQSSDHSAPIKVRMPEVMAWPAAVVEKEMETKLGAMMEEQQNFETALRAKNFTEAEQSLQKMESIAPLEYLQFLKASLKFSQGDMNAAKESVKRGLQRYPANQQGQQFLKSLEGSGQ